MKGNNLKYDLVQDIIDMMNDSNLDNYELLGCLETAKAAVYNNLSFPKDEVEDEL